MKMSILRVVSGVIAMVALAGQLAAQEPAMERIRDALPPEQVRAVEQVLARARQQNLPTEPLLEKALEGVAKHAPPTLIVQALMTKWRRWPMPCGAVFRRRRFGPFTNRPARANLLRWPSTRWATSWTAASRWDPR
ncbi:MAG: hypothetical protein P8174_11650 [Gemmatimonadota bacterium]